MCSGGPGYSLPHQRRGRLLAGDANVVMEGPNDHAFTKWTLRAVQGITARSGISGRPRIARAEDGAGPPPGGRPGACDWGQFTVSVPTVVVDDGSLTSSPEKTADMKYVPLARPFSMELPVHVATLLKSGAPVKVVSNTAVPVAPAHPVTGVPAPFWVVERWKTSEPRPPLAKVMFAPTGGPACTSAVSVTEPAVAIVAGTVVVVLFSTASRNLPLETEPRWARFPEYVAL